MRGEVENRFAETERATLRSILRAWRERHGDAGVRAARRRRMRTAEAFAVGETRREASAPWTRGVGRARTTRLASVAIVTARVPQEKTTQPSDKLFASLNGVTDERAPWRSRPSRLGRSRAARGGEMPRAVYALGDAPVRRAEPRSREDAYRLALQTDTVDYYTPSRNERMLRSGSAPGETSGGAPRQRESRVEAGRAAAPCPDHGVAEIARSCLSAARARPARLKRRRAEHGVSSID